ncbi:hypothetical protein RJT34_08663 [Clitoria ternatea]|uniref:Uncharacterized protein n=1 Tax=Clitoria ternatea TaxID=43366 RepID=A0AAN9K808_CLITE
MASNSKAAKLESAVENEEQVEIKDREEEEDEYEKKDQVVGSVTRQLCIKPIVNSHQNLDREMVLRRIRHRKRMNKVRSTVGAFLRSPFSTDTADNSSLQGKRWVDDAFAAL